MNLSAVFSLVLVLIPVSLNAASCGKRSAKRASSRIVGGSQSAPNKWPWAAVIFQNGKFHCGGTVINSRYIVSAAHCFVGQGVSASAYQLLLGAHDRDRSGTRYAVEGITIPKAYTQRSHYNDLALVRTKTAISFNSKVSPICMPSGNMGKLAGKQAMVVGWGAIGEGGSTSSILREVQIPVVDLNRCSTQYRKLGMDGISQGITDKQLCAGSFNGGKDSCQGDSGGPLMIESGSTWTLAGVVSFGEGCARKGFPGVYTRVDRYISWIGSNSRSAKKGKKG